MVWVSGTLLLMMNGVGIWNIVAYVQKRAVLQTQSIDKMYTFLFPSMVPT